MESLILPIFQSLQKVMETKKKFYKIISLIFFVFLFFSTTKNHAFSASGNITITPRTGNFATGESFQANLIIEGGGTPFNAAKATVAVSPNLSIQNLTMGNCDISFVNTPSKDNPSFLGAILGGSSNKCTLYTLVIKPVSEGDAYINVTSASIKAFKGASEILSYTLGGNYIVNGTESAIDLQPTEAPLIANGIKLYEVFYTIPVPKNTLPTSLSVVMDRNMKNPIIASPLTSNNNPNVATAIFENVTQGIHAFDTIKDGNSISKQIVNVTGNNKKIEVGVSETKNNMMFWYAISLSILFATIVIGVFVFLIKSKAISRN